MLIYISTIDGLVIVQSLWLFTNFQTLKPLLHEVLLGTVGTWNIAYKFK